MCKTLRFLRQIVQVLEDGRDKNKNQDGMILLLTFCKSSIYSIDLINIYTHLLIYVNI